MPYGTRNSYPTSFIRPSRIGCVVRSVATPRHCTWPSWWDNGNVGEATRPRNGTDWSSCTGRRGGPYRSGTERRGTFVRAGTSPEGRLHPDDAAPEAARSSVWSDAARTWRTQRMAGITVHGYRFHRTRSRIRIRQISRRRRPTKKPTWKHSHACTARKDSPKDGPCGIMCVPSTVTKTTKKTTTTTKKMEYHLTITNAVTGHVKNAIGPLPVTKRGKHTCKPSIRRCIPSSNPIGVNELLRVPVLSLPQPPPPPPLLLLGIPSSRRPVPHLLQAQPRRLVRSVTTLRDHATCWNVICDPSYRTMKGIVTAVLFVTRNFEKIGRDGNTKISVPCACPRRCTNRVGKAGMIQSPN